ncbi:TetR/AcrR family transcriptional regulator [Opitutus sp. ER46]|uniref:TetR/AcrR family transcriptional regulator n=1 Tax=Opitutus sp. ER46 TaxID=2161864 RepID=UPI000D31BDFA|nr:TetR/AcrR family transcriptional regulator [Opitutus sp. ER46]PTX91314.1 TetR/AcrR family transcriptional regulator [Opitutus sp. ER46]
MPASIHRPASPADTRNRLIAAAARVFARQGLAGATTRAIAEEAGVNEVTLFRHFQSKDGVLAAVIGQNFGDDQPEPDVAPPATADLRADLLAHARRYEKLLKHNLPLVRTMLGEIQHRHRDQEKQVFRGIFAPVKTALLARLEAAQAAGELRPDLPSTLLADLFAGMIFTGVLRRANADHRLEYSAQRYLEAAVDLVAHGASLPATRG